MKKMFFALLATMFVALATTPAFCSPYSDLDESHWAYDKINSLTKGGVLAGYPDGTFKADENVTRAEYATMVVTALGQQNAELAEIIPFVDLPRSNWAWNNVQRAVRFDLIAGNPDGHFYPYDSVTRAQTLSIAVNALSTNSISEKKAREVLKQAFLDYEAIPEWIIINAGKAEILDMVVKEPGAENIFDADKPATRAGAAVAVYNMLEQAKMNPNAKLADAMLPKRGEGIVINSATYKNCVITIPAGTLLPVMMVDKVSSQTSNIGDLFMAKVPENYITQERFIIIVENTPIAGQVLNVKVGRYFWRNGKLVLETKTIKTFKEQDAVFEGLVDTQIKRGFWATLGRLIFRGGKINIQPGQVVNVELLEPLQIDTINGRIMD